MSAPLTAADGEALAGLAVAAIAARLAGHALAGSAPQSAALRSRGASFVTLEAGGRLRGCIGSLDPVRPLYRDVIRNALSAMTDPRLPPVTAAEWPELTVSIAVLSPAEPLLCPSRDALLAALRPGVDGLVLSHGRRRATFLPKVWRKLATPERFVTALLAKGGWPPDPWPPNLAASRYTVVEFGAACKPNQNDSGTARKPDQNGSGAARTPDQNGSGTACKPNQNGSVGDTGVSNRIDSGAGLEPSR